jgi:hypothetical protein
MKKQKSEHFLTLLQGNGKTEPIENCFALSEMISLIEFIPTGR